VGVFVFVFFFGCLVVSFLGFGTELFLLFMYFNDMNNIFYMVVGG
jgi:hypothetical protein